MLTEDLHSPVTGESYGNVNQSGGFTGNMVNVK